MARADLLKKLFSSFKQEDKDTFYKIAFEIIEDERKKNHGILADDLRMILNGNYQPKRPMSSFSSNPPKDNDKEIPLVEVMYPEKYFSDLIITSEKTAQLEQIIKEFNNWDVLTSNGVYPTRRVLFYGPPGCGKTLAAQAISAEIGIPMLYVRFDALISSYLGETASNIRKVFDYAKNDSWVIFFDEFDAIGRSRNDAAEHGEIKRVVNAFLQQIDNYKGRSLVIAATNFEQSLDYAIWRRFDETIRFDMPSTDEKIKLFSMNLKRFKGPEHVFEQYINDMEAFSHSDVEKVCQIIMKMCILEGKKIYTKKDIEYAVKKQGRIVSLRKTQY
ncbi:AAA family ATPase [Extibacter muris]|uniref:AAA family ATPase n=1 Tax=Extibacter muris TaxID=1796622 RepID=UPI001D0863FE|nr:ATP-binding protein [Extibacter muris]MCB6200999.1 ATP-binding protein [Extibacter muris]MCQ4662329.1 ATP-binding protein [Extibacter muris]MCQ4691744.1 ATP-binding protein [Extibacter muris]